jgi:hypothetical protein
MKSCPATAEKTPSFVRPARSAAKICASTLSLPVGLPNKIRREQVFDWSGMVIRRNDQRRRRVVIDEVSQKNDGQSAKACKSPSKTGQTEFDSRHYTFGANRRNQFKTTDFIPKRFLSFGLVVLTLLTVVGGINLLADQSPNWQGLIGDSGVRTFSLVGVGSLSSWFSSFLLIMTGLASLQIYALRQHRCDDYRGTYRLWLWLSLLCVLGSIHCIIDFGSMVANITEAVTRQPVGGKIWALVTFKMFALTLLVVRGLYEVRESRGSLAVVVIVWVAYSAATLMQIPAIRDSMVVDYQMVYGNLVLFATSALLICQLTYARFVYLHAHGLIKPRVAVEKTEKKPVKKAQRPKLADNAEAASAATKPKSRKSSISKRKTQDGAATDVATDVATGTAPKLPDSKPVTRPPVPKPTKKDVPPVPKPTLSKATLDLPSEQSESDAPDEYAHMSKSDRRRARKLDKRARRAA